MMTYHVQFLLLVLAGWVNRQQQDVIDYQQEAAIWMTLLAWTVRSLGRHRCDRPVHRRGCEPVLCQNSALLKQTINQQLSDWAKGP